MWVKCGSVMCVGECNVIGLCRMYCLLECFYLYSGFLHSFTRTSKEISSLIFSTEGIAP